MGVIKRVFVAISHLSLYHTKSLRYATYYTNYTHAGFTLGDIGNTTD